MGNKAIRVDGCLPIVLRALNDSPSVKTLASCCGHGKYHPSIVARIEGISLPVEVFSGALIHRKKRFYVRDGRGFYYIPEAAHALRRGNSGRVR